MSPAIEFCACSVTRSCLFRLHELLLELRDFQVGCNKIRNMSSSSKVSDRWNDGGHVGSTVETTVRCGGQAVTICFFEVLVKIVQRPVGLHFVAPGAQIFLDDKFCTKTK